MSGTGQGGQEPGYYGSGTLAHSVQFQCPVRHVAKGKEGGQAAKRLVQVAGAETCVKLRFSRYPPVAWLLIPDLDDHRAFRPPTTAATSSARSRQMPAAGGGVGDDGAAPACAALPTGSQWTTMQTVPESAETVLGCLTTAMRPNAAPPAPGQLPAQVEAQTATPAVGAASRMPARRSPALRSPLTCASATSPSLARDFPHTTGHRAGRTPGRFAAACGPSYGWMGGLAVPHCCGRGVASDAVVASSSSSVVAPPAEARSLSASVAIPLQRDKRAC